MFFTENMRILQHDDQSSPLDTATSCFPHTCFWAVHTWSCRIYRPRCRQSVHIPGPCYLGTTTAHAHCEVSPLKFKSNHLQLDFNKKLAFKKRNTFILVRLESLVGIVTQPLVMIFNFDANVWNSLSNTNTAQNIFKQLPASSFLQTWKVNIIIKTYKKKQAL